MATINNNNFHENIDDMNECYPTDLSSSKHLRILQWNIRGLNDFDKFDCILVMLDQLHFPVDIIVIGETWLKQDKVSLYNIPGYKSIFSCRHSSNGGLVVHVKNSISFNVQCNVHLDGFHHIHVEVTLNSRIYDIHTFYRPPSFDVNHFLNIFVNILDKSNHIRPCFLLGDVNVPMNAYSNNVVMKYRALLESYGFVCSNTFPTRPISSNILDHAICRIDDLPRIKNDTISTEQSDHCIVITSLKLFEEREKLTLTKKVVDHQKLNRDFTAFLQNYGAI